MDSLFFVLERKKTHIFVDVDPNATGAEIVDVVAGVLEEDPSEIKLKKKKQIKDRTKWDNIKLDKPLQDYGYKPETARAEKPAHLLYVLKRDNDKEKKVRDMSKPDNL